MIMQTIRENGEDIILETALLIGAADAYTKQPQLLHINTIERKYLELHRHLEAIRQEIARVKQEAQE